MTHCILLNADYSYLNVVHWKRAICLQAKGKVEVLKDSAKTVRSSSGALFRVPAVMRLIKLIRTIYRTGVAFCKKMSLSGMDLNVLIAAPKNCDSPSITLFQSPVEANLLLRIVLRPVSLAISKKATRRPEKLKCTSM